MIQLSRENLLRPETLHALEAEVADVLEHFLPEESFGLCDTLEDLLKTYQDQAVTYPELFPRYRRALTALQFLTLNMMSAEAAAELFETRLLEGLAAGVEIEPLLTGRFYTTPDTLWPDTASAFANALRRNTERLGKRTVGQYLKRYEELFGDEKQTTLEQSRFLTQEPIVAELSDEERKALKTIVETFDGMRPVPVPEAIVKRLQSFEEMPEEELEKLEEGEYAAAPLPSGLVTQADLPQPIKSSRQALAESIEPAPLPSEAPAQEQPLVARAFEPDPFMPHKPKPIPELRGDTIALKRAPAIIAPRAATGRPMPPPPPPRPLITPAQPLPPRPAPPPSPPTVKAAPPANLPVAQERHNQGQELTRYEPDPFLTHKPKPVPRLAGNIVDLKREPGAL